MPHPNPTWLHGPHRRGGPHHKGTQPRPAKKPRQDRYVLCPACGLTGGTLGPAHRLTARTRHVGGYKGIAWRDVLLTREELLALHRGLERALRAVHAALGGGS